MIGRITHVLKDRNSARRIKHEFRNANTHNQIYPSNLFPKDRVQIGNHSYGEISVLVFGKKGKLSIGHYCSIASGVVFIPSADHELTSVSTFPFKAKLLGETPNEAVSKGDIVVGDDVWIGQNAIVLSGTTIGQGAVVSAGSVVTKDIEPYAVVAGVPAKRIKYRFPSNIIDYLKTLDYSALTEQLVREHIESLYVSLADYSLDEIINLYDWFPKKNICI